MGNDGDEEKSELGRRAFLAATFAPLASVVTVYATLPILLGPMVRDQKWYKQNFANAMGNMGEYEKGVAGMKRDLFSLINPDDTIVDLGAGLGPNIPYFPSSVSYTAVEPNQFMHSSLSEAGQHFTDPIQILDDLRLVPTASADVVISTLVFCSVKDQREVLTEVLRVLKNGGKFLFIEHVIEPSQGYPSPYNRGKFDWGRAVYSWAQSASAPLQMALADGCRGDRDTVAVISEAFSDVFVKRFHVPDLWGGEDWWNFFPIGPQVAGVAIKRPLRDPGQMAEVQFKFCAADYRLKQELKVKWEESARADEPSVRKIRCE